MAELIFPIPKRLSILKIMFNNVALIISIVHIDCYYLTIINKINIVYIFYSLV